MIDLKLSKKEKKKMDSPKEISESEYPWGTTIRFENEIIEKIPFLQNVKAGTTVAITAIGKVTEVRITDKEKGKNYENVELQIQKIDLGNADEAEESFKED